jgi:hypothetical protein
VQHSTASDALCRFGHLSDLLALVLVVDPECCGGERDTVAVESEAAMA